MSVKLSSKGQLVLPKHILQELQLKPGTEFEVEVVDRKIILQPVLPKEELQQTLAKLREIVGDTNLLDELEKERQQEKNRDDKLEQKA